MRAGRRTAQAGFTYVGLLALILFIGIALARAGEVSSTTARREREAELLFVGHQYRDAIERFYAQNRRFPMVLDELLGPSDAQPTARRYLRHLYADPMTGSSEWLLIPALGGGIAGIASQSTLPPLKVAGFDPMDKQLEAATKYSEWSFVYDPNPPRPGNPASNPPRTLPNPGTGLPYGRSPGFGAPPRIGH